MHVFNMVRTRRPPPAHTRPTLSLGVLLLLLVVSASRAFVVQPGGGRRSKRGHAPRVWDPAAATAAPGPCFFSSSCGPGRPLLVLAAEGEASSPPTAPGQAHAEAEDGLEEDVDPDMDEMLERTMHTVGIDWGGEQERGDDGHDRLVDTQQQQPPPPKVAGPAIPVDSPFAVYAAAIEPPSSHVVYYGGVHPRSFWRQGREAVQVVVPVAPATPKAAVRFRVESKTRLFLAVEDDVVFDRELAQPVYRDTSYWYFEQGDWGKAVVLELDKRLAYSNWPRLFPGDPDLSDPQQQPEQQQQQTEDEDSE